MSVPKSKKFKLYWLDGHISYVEGPSISAAFATKYSAGAMRAMDFYVEPEQIDDYVIAVSTSGTPGWISMRMITQFPNNWTRVEEPINRGSWKADFHYRENA